jgi:dihydrofolate reductase
MQSTTAYLFGRKTYEKMAAHWPTVGDENPMAAHLNQTPKYVATRTLATATWSNSRIIGDDLASEVAALKADGDGTISVLGSGDLVQTLIADDLVDGFQLLVHPLLLGTGKRLFRSLAHPRALRLTNLRSTPTGVVMLDYALDDRDN